MIPFPAAERNDTRNGSYIMLKHTILPYGNLCPRGYMQKDNIIAHQLLASRRFSLLTAEAGILTSLPYPDTFPPELQKGAVALCQERNNGAYSCGTVGDLHSIPFSARYRRTSTFQSTPKSFNVDSTANVYHFFENNKDF